MALTERKRILITEHAPERSEGIPELLHKFGVETQVVKLYENEPLPSDDHVDAIISGGGPMGTYEMHKPEYDFLTREADYLNDMIAKGKVVLGICLGHQLLAHILGGNVNKSPENREVGWSKIIISPDGKNDPLFKDLPSELWTFQYHGDAVLTPPTGSIKLSESQVCPIQALRFKDNVWGVQFHPEISPEKAERILSSRKEALEAEGMDVVLSIRQGYDADHQPRKQIFYNLTKIIQSL